VCQASSVVQREYLVDPQASCSHLLGYTLLSAAVDACPLIMFAVAPETAFDTPTLELARAFHPDEPTRGAYGSHRSFRSADRSFA